MVSVKKCFTDDAPRQIAGDWTKTTALLAQSSRANHTNNTQIAYRNHANNTQLPTV